MTERMSGYCPMHGQTLFVTTKAGERKCAQCINERRKAPRLKWFTVKTRTGFALNVCRDGEDFRFQHDGRPVAYATRKALELSQKKGLHLSQDADPSLWLSPETISLLLTLWPA